MKFLVDMPLSPALAAWLRGRGHDAVHAGELGMHSAPDTAIMAALKREARTIVTADLDYTQLLSMARTAEPSVILFRDGNWNEVTVIARMADVPAALAPDQIEQSIVVVERERIRRRRLPLGS